MKKSWIVLHSVFLLCVARFVQSNETSRHCPELRDLLMKKGTNLLSLPSHLKIGDLQVHCIRESGSKSQYTEYFNFRKFTQTELLWHLR